MKIREAAFALRVIRRRAGDAAILYRRTLNKSQQERLTKVGTLSPLAFTAGTPLLRMSVRRSGGQSAKLAPGPFLPLDADWGARVACYSLVAMGLRNADRLHKAASHLQQADGTEAAWWFGLMSGGQRMRAIRALRILVEAVR